MPGYGRGILAMMANFPPSREINYAMLLRDLKSGWTLEQRRAYFTFLDEAAKGSGGASFPGFLENIRSEALANCTDQERTALADTHRRKLQSRPDIEILPPKGPGRAWTQGEAVAVASRGKADFANGRQPLLLRRLRGLPPLRRPGRRSRPGPDQHPQQIRQRLPHRVDPRTKQSHLRPVQQFHRDLERRQPSDGPGRGTRRKTGHLPAGPERLTADCQSLRGSLNPAIPGIADATRADQPPQSRRTPRPDRLPSCPAAIPTTNGFGE